MFTGIIETIGELVTAKTGNNTDCRLSIHCGPDLLKDVKLGDSIAVSGVCLTVVHFDEHRFDADVSAETLRCTTLGALKTGDVLNLERALLPTTRLGGHFVSGHVDGLGKLVAIQAEGDSKRLSFSVDQALSRFIAAKGSIAIDGVSLTVNGIESDQFWVNLVPHTQLKTTLTRMHPGAVVNIEVDMLARYIARFVQTTDNAKLDQAFLEQHGYV